MNVNINVTSINPTLILLAIPVFLLQLGLIIYNLISLKRKTRTNTMSKPVWWILILFFGYVGNIAYLLVEGGNKNEDGD